MKQLSIFSEPQEQTVEKPTFLLETHVSYRARAVNAPDGLRIEFTVPVHSDLLPYMTDPERRTIPVKARCWKGFKWGQLGQGADVRLHAVLDTGTRGGQYLYCDKVEIIKGVPRNGPKLPKSIIRNLEKQYATN